MKYTVFCDVDGTLTYSNNMMSFLKFVEEHHSTSILRKIAIKIHVTVIEILRKLHIKREILNKIYYLTYAGYGLSKIDALTNEWFKTQDKKTFYNPNVKAFLQKHHEQGAEIVLISGGFEPTLRHIANEVSAKAVICTNSTIRNDKYTGKTEGPAVIGNGKKIRITHYAKIHDLNLKDCYAVGDHISDLPMLKMVGYPIVVKSDPDLIEYAKNKSWNIIY